MTKHRGTRNEQQGATQLWTLIDAGVPAPATAAFAFLVRLEVRGDDPPTLLEIAGHYGVSRQAAWRWMRDLLSLSVVEKERKSRAYVYRVSCKKTLQLLKRRDDGRVQRCAVCRSLNPRGRWCADCKQTHGRADRAWWPHVEKLLRQGMNPHAIHATLARRQPPIIAPVWDHVVEGQKQNSPGIVSRGLMLHLLDDDWAERQREALTGSAGDDW